MWPGGHWFLAKIVIYVAHRVLQLKKTCFIITPRLCNVFLLKVQKLIKIGENIWIMRVLACGTIAFNCVCVPTYCTYARIHVNRQSNTDEPTRCNNDLLIYKISSTCFGQYFAHHQERETWDIYGIWYPVVVAGRETVSGSVAHSATLPHLIPWKYFFNTGGKWPLSVATVIPGCSIIAHCILPSRRDDTRVGILIVATIYLQLIWNRYMSRSFAVLQCSHKSKSQGLKPLWLRLDS